jgi:hypothetical protein
LQAGSGGAFPAPPPDARSPSVIEAPRGEHSEKPDALWQRSCGATFADSFLRRAFVVTPEA